MSEKRRIGIFLCRCGGNIADVVDVAALCEGGLKLPDVEFTMFNSFTCSAEGQGKIKEMIAQHKLDGVVIGSCTPRQYEELFRATIAEAGINPFLLEIVNLREQCAYPHGDDHQGATEKARLLIKAAVEKARLLVGLEVKKARISTEVAVIGAGIAGIHASSTLAKLGYTVHLIEREPTVGGNMARVVKTFPTDDCSMCTISPKMDEMSKTSRIHLMTYTEVEDIKKVKEGLRITLRRKPRYLDEASCTGCGKCTDNCPVTLYNEYNLGLESTRKAVYKPFPAAVPNKFVINKRGIPPCREACPVHQNAQGYIALVAAGKYKEAYDVIRRDNPLPSVCGRVCNHVCEERCSREPAGGPLAIRALKAFVTSHPDNAEDRLPQLPEPKPFKVAVVGGGPSGLACAHDLALHGIRSTVFEAHQDPGGVLALSLPRYRLPKAVLDRDIDYIRRLGVDIRTGERVDSARLQALLRDYDAVYLAIGLTKDKLLRLPGHDAPGVRLGGAFLQDVKDGKAGDLGSRVLVIGGGNVAFDVARSALRLGAGRKEIRPAGTCGTSDTAGAGRKEIRPAGTCGTSDTAGAPSVELMCLESAEEMPALPDEIREGLEEGLRIHHRTSPQRFLSEGGRLTGVETVKVERIEIDELGRLKPVTVPGSEAVIAADTVIFAIGQGPDLDPLKDSSIATDARGLVAADPESLKTNVPKLYAGGDAVSGPATVVAAMARGKQAARSIARDLGHPIADLQVFADLAEVKREDALELGRKAGHTDSPRTDAPVSPAAQRARSFDPIEGTFTEADAVAEAKRCLQCGGCCDCRVCASVCEAKSIHYDQAAERSEITVGGVIVATGFKDYDPSRLNYGYGRFKNVVTHFQLARMIDPIGPTEGKIVRPSDRKAARRIVMLQCVGSRGDAQGRKHMHSYCSRVCCMVSLKHAGLIKKNFDPDAEITICYIDMRAFGKGYEEYYERVKSKGVRFIKGMPAEVREDPATGDLTLDMEDQLTSSRVKLRADLVVLATATEPADGVHELMRLLMISKDEYGFIREFHPKIRPTDTTVKNIMVAGAAQGPKDITDTISQAGSAAASLAGYIGDGYITLNPLIAHVDSERCRACGRCEEFCEFQAVQVGEHLHAEVEPALCEGCGKCAVICPTGAITVYGAEDAHVEAMLEALKAP